MFRLPGAFWVALIMFIMQWLPQIFPDAPWIDTAALVLLALLKAVEVLVGVQENASSVRDASFMRNASSMRKPWFWFWLFG